MRGSDSDRVEAGLAAAEAREGQPIGEGWRQSGSPSGSNTFYAGKPPMGELRAETREGEGEADANRVAAG